MDEARARERLEHERKRLEQLRNSTEAQEATRGDRDSTNELTSIDQHPADVGTEMFEREKELSILEHVEAALEDIDAALERLDKGTYGRCTDCGEPIADERLAAMPAARRCVRHQAEVDRLG